MSWPSVAGDPAEGAALPGGLAARRPFGWLALILLGLAAAAYFLLSCTEGIDSLDEGHLIYFSWRTAQGELPYRAFQHWYGPSVFVLNALLFRLGGAQLLVARGALVILRASCAVALFVLTEAAAGAAAGMVAYAASLAVLGAPLWVFNTPYANNYQLPLTVAALAVYLRAPAGARTRLLLAGGALGLALTFKPTGGILAYVGFLLFLLARPHSPAASSRLDVEPVRWRVVQGAVAVGAVGVLAVFSTFIVQHPEAAVLITPIVLLSLWTLGRSVRVTEAAARRNLGDIAWLTLGCALAPLAYAAWYAAQGALSALLWATLVGLPRRFTLYVPFPVADLKMLLPLAGGAIVLTVLLSRRVPASLRPLAGGIGTVLLATVAGYGIAAMTGVLGPVRQSKWPGQVVYALIWLPPASVWAACLVLLVRRDPPMAGAPAALTCVSSAALPALVPVADWAHAALIAPVFFPLAAYILALVGRGEPARPLRHVAAAVALVACVAALAAPFVASLLRVRLAAAAALGLPHASWIHDRSPTAAATRDLVSYLRSGAGAGQPLLVVPSGAMLYFLTDRMSALEDDEFAFYAGSEGPQLAPADARALVDEDDAVRRLAAQRPQVVRVGDRRGAVTAFRTVFPILNRYLDTHYRAAATFGPYQVLEPEPPMSGGRDGEGTASGAG